MGRVLVVHGVDGKRWAERYGIEPFSTKCTRCGATRTTTQPIASGHMRGLRAPDCACGSPEQTYCLVPINGAERIL